MVKPPSQNTCLWMAEMASDQPRSEKMMWDCLFCWGFYEHWLDAYWSKE